MNEKPTDHSSLVPRATKWLVATLVGLGTGAANFYTQVRTGVDINAKSFDEIKPARIEHGKRLKSLRESRLKDEITNEIFKDLYKKEKNAYSDLLVEQFEKLGIHSKDWTGLTKGSLDRFGLLSRNSKMSVAFGAGATTVIGFAGTLMFLNSLDTHDHLNELRHKIDTVTNRQNPTER